MKNIKSFVLIVSPLMLALTACQPPSNSSNPGHATSTDKLAEDLKPKVDLARQKCLNSLKTQMTTNSFSFDVTASSSAGMDLQKIQDSLPTLNSGKVQWNLGYDADDEKVYEIGEERTLKAEGSEKKLDLNIGAPPASSTEIFSVSISYSERGENQKRSISQGFLADVGCKLRLTRTFVSAYSRKGGDIHLSETTIYPGSAAGSVLHKEGEAHIERDAIFDPQSNDDSKKTLQQSLEEMHAHKVYVALDADTPAVLAQFDDHFSKIKHFDPIIGKNVDFDEIKVAFNNGTKKIVGFVSAKSTASDFSFGQALNSSKENWTVDEKTWKNAVLVTDLDKTTREINADPKIFDSDQQVRIELITRRDIKYENFSAYWTTEKKERISEGVWKRKYILTSQNLEIPESGAPLVTDETRLHSDPTLMESELVQISAPEMKPLIAKLKHFKNLNRAEMALKVSEIVQQNLTFDDEAVDLSLIHVLPTSDILKRHKGVCQHFANLFAALGRSVGLPVRIISGLFLDSKGAGGHAWNEIEITSGVWQPIEPQHSRLNFVSSHYFPIQVSRGYESSKLDGELLQEALNIEQTKFKLKLIDSVYHR